jgi:hypothetical protein
MKHEPLSLDELGILLAKAVRRLPAADRKRLGEMLMQDLKKPVGKLGRNK